jgi:hypothetical protein
MDLKGYVTSGLESLGLNGTQVKPINQGERVTVVGSEQQESSNLWGIFDGLGETVGKGANDLLEATFDRYVTKTQNGVAANPGTRGDPSDNPGDATVPESQRAPMSMFRKYQSEIIVGGVLLGGYLLVRGRR